MQGRVLNDDEIDELEQIAGTPSSFVINYEQDVLNLIATIRDREKKHDKTISDCIEVVKRDAGLEVELRTRIRDLERQNSIMREALEKIEHRTMSMGYASVEDFANDLKRIAREALAKIHKFEE
jgi:small-conductance mechanosensitive channel